MYMKAIHRLFAMFLSVCVGVSALAAGVGAHEVKFVGGQFAVDGRAVQIRAGEIEPQRIPREYWRHRVKLCKAMGLNAISSYFMWNDFERPDGSFDFKTGSRDVAAFMALCREEGMWLLFRPGPYICGEWDFGGIPARLLKEDIAVRSMDPRYLSESEKYLSAIADIAEPFLAKNGGPILLTQIEKEYGYRITVDYDRYDEDKLNLMFSSAELPDIVYFYTANQAQIVLENVAIRLAVFHFGRNRHSRNQPAKDSPDQKACKENGQPGQNDPDPRACHTQITRELFRRRELFH